MLTALAVVATILTGQVPSKEVLVLTTSTEMPRSSNGHAIEIQNNGPNEIWCGLGASSRAVLTKSRRIAAKSASASVPSDSWAIDLPPNVKVFCICSVAQVTGAATHVAEAIQ